MPSRRRIAGVRELREHDAVGVDVAGDRLERGVEVLRAAGAREQAGDALQPPVLRLGLPRRRRHLGEGGGEGDGAGLGRGDAGGRPRRRRTGDRVALAEVDVQVGEALEVLERLDALGADGGADLRAKRTNDSISAALGRDRSCDAGDERAVELDDVGRAAASRA